MHKVYMKKRIQRAKWRIKGMERKEWICVGVDR